MTEEHPEQGNYVPAIITAIVTVIATVVLVGFISAPEKAESAADKKSAERDAKQQRDIDANTARIVRLESASAENSSSVTELRANLQAEEKLTEERQRISEQEVSELKAELKSLWKYLLDERRMKDYANDK